MSPCRGSSSATATKPVRSCSRRRCGSSIPAVLGFDLELVRFDLSLGNRRATANAVVREAAAAMRDTGLGLKAATITPEQTGDVGSPNRILREGVGGSVIVRTGRRIPGVAPPAPVVHPIVVVRMAVGDAYGAEEGRTGEPGGMGEKAWRTERIDRSVCRSVAEFSFRTAVQLGACVYGGPKWTVSTVYEGMLKEEMDAAAARYPGVPYRPTLIDAAYVGLLTESSASALVVPALNRDGDCLSDLVLALFGSIAGAESVLLALGEDLQPVVAMAEAPHGTAPSLMGKNVRQPHGDALGLRRRPRLRRPRRCHDRRAGHRHPPGHPRRGGRRDSHLRPGW